MHAFETRIKKIIAESRAKNFNPIDPRRTNATVKDFRKETPAVIKRRS
jgi:hypothetical protein